MERESDHLGSPATLVAIIVAARRSEDRDLERAARNNLETRYGIRLSFGRQSGRQMETALAR